MKQIKSKKRVRDFGEVYTQPREVNAMLDLVKEESCRTGSLFLEPACGNGNFLVEILKRKLTVAQNKEEVTTSLSSIYAIDILEDGSSELLGCIYNDVKTGVFSGKRVFGKYGYGGYRYGYGKYGYGRYDHAKTEYQSYGNPSMDMPMEELELYEEQV